MFARFRIPTGGSLAATRAFTTPAAYRASSRTTPRTAPQTKAGKAGKADKADKADKAGSPSSPVSSGLAWLLNTSADTIATGSATVNAAINAVGATAAKTITESTASAKAVLPDEPVLPLPRAATSTLSAAASIVRGGTSLTKSVLGVAADVGGAAGRIVGSSVSRALPRDAKGTGLDGWVDSAVVDAAGRLVATSSDAVVSVLDTVESNSAAVVDSSLGGVSDIVGQTMGPEAGDVVRANLTVVNDAVRTAYKVKSFGLRKMGKSSAKAFQKQALRSVLIVQDPATHSPLVFVPLMTASNASHSRPIIGSP